MAVSAAHPSRHGLAWLGVGLPALGLAIVAGLWLVLWFTLQADRARVQEDAFARVKGLTQAFEAHTQRSLHQIDLLTQFLAYEHTRHGSALDLSGVLREGLLSQPGLVAVSLFDARGDRIGSTADGAHFNIADRAHFKVHQENRHAGMYVAPPLLGRGENSWLVFMTRRLQAAGGGFAGVVIVAVDPTYFISFYNEAQFGQKGMITLVGLDGVVRARRSGDKVWFGEKAGHNYLIHQLRKASEGVYKASIKLDGVPRFLAYKMLTGYPLVAVTGLAEEEVWAPHQQWSKTLWVLSVLATALLTAAFAGLSWLAQRLRRKHAQLAYVHSRFEAASNAQMDAFLILRALRDKEGRIVDFRCEHCNDRTVEMVGIPRERLLSATRSELMGPSHDLRLFDMYCRVIATGKAEEGEFLMTHPAAGRWLHHQVVPVDGGVAITTRDVTALRQHTQEIEQAQLALQTSEARLRSITENIPALVAYLDREQRFRFANRHYRRLLGVDPQSLIGRTLGEVRGPEIYAKLQAHVEGALRGEQQQFEVQGEDRGKPFYYQYNYVPEVASDGGVQGFFAMGFDVTVVKNAELLQQQSEQRLRAITDNLPVLISYIDAEQRVEFCNQTCFAWWGLDPRGIVGQPLRQVFSPQLYALCQPFLARALRGERVEFEVECEAAQTMRTLQSTYLPDMAGNGSGDSEVKGVFMLSSDVTALKRVERQLTVLARFDTLTGLANRHQFNERLADALARAQRSGEALALMFLDIDHFKSINDTFGHAAGDGVLKEFAARLGQCVRTTDLVARLAGDEFVVLLESVHSEAEPQFVARKIVGQINRPFEIGGHELAVTTSVGIAFHRDGVASPEELLARADKALYAAKSAGRNTYNLAVS